MAERSFLGSLVLVSAISFVLSVFELDSVSSLNLLLTVLILVLAVAAFLNFSNARKAYILILTYFVVALIYNGILFLSLISNFLLTIVTVINILGLVTALSHEPSPTVKRLKVRKSLENLDRKKTAAKKPAKKKVTKKTSKKRRK